jgi:chromosome segregation ATPase
VARLRKHHDEYKTKSSRCRKALDELKDVVRELELDSARPHMEVLLEPSYRYAFVDCQDNRTPSHAQDNEYTRKIRSLENKLDKAMIKFNEAQSIRKTYEQIVKRLKEERVGFDNQVSIFM